MEVPQRNYTLCVMMHDPPPQAATLQPNSCEQRVIATPLQSEVALVLTASWNPCGNHD